MRDQEIRDPWVILDVKIFSWQEERAEEDKQEVSQ